MDLIDDKFCPLAVTYGTALAEIRRDIRVGMRGGGNRRVTARSYGEERMRVPSGMKPTTELAISLPKNSISIRLPDTISTICTLPGVSCYSTGSALAGGRAADIVMSRTAKGRKIF